MNTMKICSGCQKPLEADAPDGLCPECLLKAGLGTAADGTGPTAVPPASAVKTLPPLEGAGATWTARGPWAVAIAAVVLLIPMGLITGWLLLRYSGKAVTRVSPEEPTLRPRCADSMDGRRGEVHVGP